VVKHAAALDEIEAFVERAELEEVGLGKAQVAVYARPRVALLATGDEIVAVAEKPRDFQIRNSNVYSLAAQVTRAGGIPEILGVAKDVYGDTRGLVERGLASDLLLISGGVSAGKYDIVERVLATEADFVGRVPQQPLLSKFVLEIDCNLAR